MQLRGKLCQLFQYNFSGCRWRAFYYNSVLAFGIFVLWDKPWLWDIRYAIILIAYIR